MKLRAKLIGGFSTILVLLIVAGGIAFLMFGNVKKSTVDTNEGAELSHFLTQKEVDHFMWMADLSDQFLLDKTFEAQLDPHKCGLGKWYYAFETDDPELKRLHKELEEPHIRLHESGKKVKEIYAKPDFEMDERMTGAKAAHLGWMMALTEIWQKGGEPFAKPTDPRECGFGKWYYAFETDDAEIKAILDKIEEPHRKLHESAIAIVNLTDSDGLIRDPVKQEEARMLYKEQSEPIAMGLLDYFTDIKHIVHDRSLAYEESLEIYTAESQAAVAEVQPILSQMSEHLKKNAETATERLYSKMTMTKTIVLAIVIFAVVVGVFLMLIITKGTLKQVGGEPADIALITQRIADGDLRLDSDEKGGKESTGIFAAVMKMAENLKNIVMQIQDGSAEIASSSEEMSSSAQQLSEGAQNQASTLEETSASVEELTASVEQVSEHAQSQTTAVEQSTTSMDQVQKSVEEVSKTLSSVSEIATESVSKSREGAETVGKAVEAINLISESSDNIAGIVNVISDIADQTNLLALNASIEAARAGEHGRGFAVVADEVSKLADRSGSSTKEIEALIKESAKNVKEGVELAQGSKVSMEQITEGAQKSANMIDELASALEQQATAIKEMANAIGNISEMSQSISAATEEQSSNAKQTSKAIESVNEITQQAASAAEEMAASTEELSGMAQQLQGLVAQFKMDDTGLDKGVKKLSGPGIKEKVPDSNIQEVTGITLKKETAA